MSARGLIIGGMDRGISPAMRATIKAQAGVVSRRQLLRDGTNRMTIVSKLKSGRWRQIHHGVYMTFSGELTRQAELLRQL